MSELNDPITIVGSKVKGVKVNVSEYARQNNISWNTAKKYISGKPKRKKRTSKKESKLHNYIEILEHKLTEYHCSATALYYFINEKGYTGSKSLVIKKVKTLKKDLLKKATLRVESTPGLQAQVDWKESLTLFSRGKEAYTVNIFLYILSYSKYKYIELTIDRIQPTLFNCMVNAFRCCGGVPEEIWFDNIKTVVDEHNVTTNTVRFNSKFLEFSKNCGFKAIACKPFRPCTKGIVENLAKVMERLRVYNEEFDTYEELNEIVKRLNIQLNLEVSQATNEVCEELFISKEKEYLTAINLEQFSYKPAREVRKVSNESMINYKGAKYSVPTDYLYKLVEVEVKDNQLQIYYSGNMISSHTISNKKFNYRREDLIQIVEGIFPHNNSKEIDEMVNNRLNGYDIFARGGKHNEK